MYQHQYCYKIRVNDLNEHLMCVLCGGYFIDATTIIECLHSFCRSCIVRYLESSKYCPICDVQVHKTRPLLNIRSDKTLQDLVYKLVPGLFDEEMRRRREFLRAHPEVKTNRMDLEQRGQALLVPVHSLPDQHISLVLHMATPGIPAYSETKRSSARSKKAGDRRYLLCPSDVTVGILKKFLRCKFSLPDKHQIDIFYTQSEETISDDFTLLDITFIYSWSREKPLRLFYTIYEKPRRKRRLRTDGLLKLQSSQAKKARMEQADQNGADASSHIHKSSKISSSTGHVSHLKKLADGRSVSTTKICVAPSYLLARQKMKTMDFWKRRPRDKLKAKRKKFENVKKAGRGRKQNAKTPPEKPNTVKRRGRPGNSKPGAIVKRANHLLNGKGTCKVSAGSPEPDKDGNLSTKATSASGKRPSSPNLQTSLQGQDSNTAVASANGAYRTSIKTSHDSGSVSPKLSTPGSSRSSSPRLTTTSPGKSGQTGSPRPKSKTKAKDTVNVSSSKEDSKVSGGRDSSRPSSRGSSRTDSPKPAHLQHVVHLSTLPSLPVDEKISVDVNMAVSASETSSDVTSPGAEDRANSTGLEEAGDFHGSAGHVCNVATFTSRPFPTLMNVSSNGHRQIEVKGSGRRQNVDKGIEHKPNTNKNGKSKQYLDKGNGHKQRTDDGNGLKQSSNRSNGHKDGMDKVNGHRQGINQCNGSNQSNNRNHGQKRPMTKGGQIRESTKTSQLQMKSSCKTLNKKKQ